jgi:hypothetical protein
MRNHALAVYMLKLIARKVESWKHHSDRSLETLEFKKPGFGGVWYFSRSKTLQIKEQGLQEEGLEGEVEQQLPQNFLNFLSSTS